ncbi:HAD family phosphatase [Streptomyces sp. H10-C2]|uniref:HAD family hydrolase n=1 Tax=unclassified Streptomyces TaxID=2593676 RepID=UPI0024B9583E|nr:MULTISPECIES: HAD family phosphatase [unclassified Streptomyces]MDJ0345071.1 HAD family phosphatase [Streptomyces sp. PH10-H1]MDJ0373976.1 HAD family phosphatase [Streptomyces sp. H10-C2]
MTPIEAGQPGISRLRSMLARAECVLFDFDGPLCDLFAGSPAAGIARQMREYLAAHDVSPAGLRRPDDPHDMLRQFAGHELAADLEGLLSQGEELAAVSAEPTPDAEEFVRRVAESRLVAVTTNNSPVAVQKYLESRNLGGFFGVDIFGRTANAALMKPHPDCLRRAAEAMGVPPERCLMLGDSAPDAEAAARAGVPFLGYARSGEGEQVTRLFDAGAGTVVVGMAPLLAAIGGGLATPTE